MKTFGRIENALDYLLTNLKTHSQELEKHHPRLWRLLHPGRSAGTRRPPHNTVAEGWRMYWLLSLLLVGFQSVASSPKPVHCNPAKDRSQSCTHWPLDSSWSAASCKKLTIWQIDGGKFSVLTSQRLQHRFKPCAPRRTALSSGILDPIRRSVSLQ